MSAAGPLWVKSGSATNENRMGSGVPLSVPFSEDEINEMLKAARTAQAPLTPEQLAAKKEEHVAQFKIDLLQAFRIIGRTSVKVATVGYRRELIDPEPVFDELRRRGYIVCRAAEYPFDETKPNERATIYDRSPSPPPSQPVPTRISLRYPAPPAPPSFSSPPTAAAVESFCIVQ